MSSSSFALPTPLKPFREAAVGDAVLVKAENVSPWSRKTLQWMLLRVVRLTKTQAILERDVRVKLDTGRVVGSPFRAAQIVDEECVQRYLEAREAAIEENRLRAWLYSLDSNKLPVGEIRVMYKAFVEYRKAQEAAGSGDASPAGAAG